MLKIPKLYGLSLNNGFRKCQYKKKYINYSKNEAKNFQIPCIYDTRVVCLLCLNCCLQELRPENCVPFLKILTIVRFQNKIFY